MRSSSDASHGSAAEHHRQADTRFDALYRAHQRALYAYAYYRAPSRADDIVAETFLVAWRRLDQAPAYPLPWLYAIARRVVAGASRSQAAGDGSV